MSASSPEFSVVMPVYHEGAAIVPRLDELGATLPEHAEVLVVYDAESDPTLPYLTELAAKDPRFHPLLNTYGRGPARALRFGLDHVSSDVAVITMGDGSDDPSQIGVLAQIVRSGTAIAAASRYVPGGGQLGGPIFKRSLSHFAGWSLHQFAGVPIHDVTSAFKAYSMDFVRSVRLQSTQGFEISLELVAKAHRLRLPMAEVPTVWRDRTEGTSHFRLFKWLPRYLRWFALAFGRQLTVSELDRRTHRRGR